MWRLHQIYLLAKVTRTMAVVQCFYANGKCKNIGESEPAKDRQQENTLTSLFSLILSCSSVLTPKEPE